MAKKQNEFWDNRSAEYDENIQKHDVVYQKSIEGVRKLISNTDHVLDFGCATGEMSVDIAPYAAQVHGIDLSEKMIQIAQQKAVGRGLNNIQFSQTDLFDQSLLDRSYSIVMAFNVFHLVVDFPKVLQRINDLLPVGGMLISQTPCLAERNWLFRWLINMAQKSGWAPTIQSFNISDLEKEISNANFKITTLELWDKKNAVQWIVAQK